MRQAGRYMPSKNGIVRISHEDNLSIINFFSVQGVSKTAWLLRNMPDAEIGVRSYYDADRTF